MNFKKYNMSNFKKSIIDAVNLGINKALNESNISREEALADYDTLDWTDNATKKALASKYGIDSKKAKEIQYGIAKYLRVLRFSQTTFDEIDIKAFSNLGWYDSYKKESEMFDQEPKQFIEYIKNYRWDYLVKKGLDKKLNWGNYGISMADKAAINRYKNVDRWLIEHSLEFKKKEDRTDRINNILQEQMAEYKALYLQKVCDMAKQQYIKFPSKMKQYYEEYQKADKEFSEWYKNDYMNNRRKYGWGDYHEHQKVVDISKMKYNQVKYMLDNFTEKEYIEDVRKNAEKEFDANTLVVAARINEKNIDVDHLNISEVGSDPKYFEMMVSDGVQKFYARSILAAEFSDKMVPHFRFIITDRSKFIR